MDSLSEHDWKCLERINLGRHTDTAIPAASRKRLLALRLAIAQRKRGMAITGLGREALLRHRRRLPAAFV